MPEPTAIDQVLARLNPEQRAAAVHGQEPLLIVAGAGTGKTTTLVQRVAWLIDQRVPAERILLLSFTRRAAAEMVRRVEGTLRQLAELEAGIASPEAARRAAHASRVWGGTFHAIATRLLRRFGKSIGLPVGFSIHDRADSEDLVNVVRTELGLAKVDKRFPHKGTCLAIYSRCINARQPLGDVLRHHFPWCEEWAKELKLLFNAYVDRKEAGGVLDYDDLLLYWHALLNDEAAGQAVRGMFDCVLVDEYQDTNTLQAEIVYRMSPGGQGLTVVGDDAQSIYAFRAATVRNILDLPKHYPNTCVVTLVQNYRSTQPILDATNDQIALAKERYTKNLWSERTEGERPELVLCDDEDDQTEWIIRRVLEHREAGIDLRRQAILFRASHHSMMLEAELTHRGIPFHKYGGLKFVEAAHVKDLMAFLRLAENPRDLVAGCRVLVLIPGVGPAKARQLMQGLLDAGGDFAAWSKWQPPSAAKDTWPELVRLFRSLAHATDDLPTQVGMVRKFYRPLLELKYDLAQPRLRDLEQLEQLAAKYRSRERMLQEITLDPPSSTQDLAGPPHLDDDYLVLSTIHSAKGLEWDAVFVIHASDGNIPSDMATKSPDEIEEERRLFYVALTRAKSWLHVCCPLRYHYRPGASDAHGFAQLTRFLPPAVQARFDRKVTGVMPDDAAMPLPMPQSHLHSQAVRRQAKSFWE
ncbi:MAG: ATP-dependent helicase [Patescibacteria group bacterium]|nr:ATP-dependent helicase [Patescibacteria group bacterium]